MNKKEVAHIRKQFKLDHDLLSYGFKNHPVKQTPIEHNVPIRLTVQIAGKAS
ncbi:DUF4317 domain-containing protein [Paenibacillus campinasensis]|uniref:DUF4317 domain-containing protein n=1 Tax=Paenibacillus campinasensis TaxID=66347 RepID=UPI001C52D9EC|nr:DUF4317 domain-containing protein [Paenibacillus campinasensis]